MSDRTPPPPRRRIAGETPAPQATAAEAAEKATTKKAPAAKKSVAKKAPAARKAAPTTKASAAKKAPAKKSPAKKATAIIAAADTAQAPVAKKSPAKKAPVKKAPVKKAPVKKAPVKKAPSSIPSAVSLDQAAEATTTSVTPQVARLRPRTAVRPDDKPPTDRRAAIALALAVVVLVVGGAVGTLGFLRWTSNSFEDSRTQAVAAASGAAETIFSFSYDELDEHLAESKELMTPTFAKEFDTIAPALTDIAPQRKVVVEAVARNSAALPCGDECSDSKASVLVFLDQDRRLGDDDSSTVFGNRIVVDLIKSSGDWKVDQIRAL